MKIIRFHLTIIPALIALILTFSACAPAPAPPESAGAWPARVVLAQSQQTAAPAVAVADGRVVSVWIGADAGGVHQDARLLDANGSDETVVLPLPPRHPYAQQLIPASEGYFHLLWLDADENGITRLYGALLTPDLRVQRGPTALSSDGARRYAASREADGGLWVISSGGPLSEPLLSAHRVDAQGRPRLLEKPVVVENGDWPALRRAADGMLWLYWLRPFEGRVWAAPLNDGQAGTGSEVGDAPALNAGDRLESFHVGQDGTHRYLFWNLTRASGARESWWSAGPLQADRLPVPVRLGLGGASGARLETGFAGGAVEAVGSGPELALWVIPLAQPAPMLPAAAMLASGQIGMIYFREGAPVGLQPLGPAPALLGPPVLVTDGDGHLYLTTAEPGAEAAALVLRSTRALPSPP